MSTRYISVRVEGKTVRQFCTTKVGIKNFLHMTLQDRMYADIPTYEKDVFCVVSHRYITNNFITKPFVIRIMKRNRSHTKHGYEIKGLVKLGMYNIGSYPYYVVSPEIYKVSKVHHQKIEYDDMGDLIDLIEKNV